MILKCLVLFLNYLVAKKYDTAKLILTTPSNRKLSTKGNLLNEKEKDNELFEFYYIGDNEHTTSNFGLVSSTGKLMGKEDGKITLLSNFEYEELLKDYLFCKTPENKDDPKCNKEKSKDKKDKDKKKGKNDKLEKEEEPEYDEDKGEDEDKTKEKKKKNEDNTENTIDKIPKEEILLFSPRVDDSKGWGIAIANTNFCLEHIQNNVKISECPPLGFGGENFRWKFNMKYNQNTKKQFENGLLNSENYDHLAKTPKKKKRFKKINQSPPSTTLLVQQQIPISQDQTHIQPPMIAQETQPQPMNMIQQPQTEIQLNQPVQKNIKKRKYDEYEDDEDQSEDNENNQKRVHVKDQDTEDKDEDNISEEIEIIRKKPQRKRRFTEQRPAQKIFISNPENQQQNVVYETNQQQQNPPVNFVFQQPQQQQPNALNQSSLLGNIASSTPAGMGANLLAGGINSLSRVLSMVYRVRIKNLLNKEFLRRTDDGIEMSKQPGAPRTDFFVKMSNTKKREKEALIYEHIRNKKARYVIFDKDKNKLSYQNEPSPFSFVYRQNVFNIKTGNNECLHVDANQQIRLEKCSDRSQNQKFTLQVLKKNSRVSKNLKNNERMMVEVEGKDFKRKDKKIHEDNVYIKYDDDKENESDDKDETSEELINNSKSDKNKGDYKVSQEILTDTEEEPAILKTDHVSKVLHSTLYTTVIVNKTSTVFSTIYHTSTSSIIGNKTDLVTIDPSYTAELKPIRQVRPKTDKELTAVADIDDSKPKKASKFNRLTNMFKKPFKWSKNKKEEEDVVERHEGGNKSHEIDVRGFENGDKRIEYGNLGFENINDRLQHDNTEHSNEYFKNLRKNNQFSDSTEEHLCDNLDIKECRDLNIKRPSSNNIYYKEEPRQDFRFKRKKQSKTPEKENVKLRDDIMLQYFEEPRISDFIDDIPDMDLKTFIGREKNTFYKNDSKNLTVNNTKNDSKNLRLNNTKILQNNNNLTNQASNKQVKENFNRFDPPVELKNTKKTDNLNQNKINQKNKLNQHNNSERGGLLSYVGFDGSIGDDFVDSSDDELLGGLRLNL